MHRLAIVVLALSVGCHKNAAVKTTPTAVVTPQPVPTATAVAEPKPASPNVAVSDDLARQCSVEVDNVQSSPKFDYNEAQLLPQDRDVLAKIATCVTTGPLKGKQLQLVGRADPRGTEEYNLGLGSRRAGIVGDYLQRLGVLQAQLASTTRGALDASGSDERTWKTDRRVDVRLE